MTRTAELRAAGAIHRPGSARELLAATLGEDPYERLEELRRAGERMARAEGVAYQMEHERHIVLARVVNEYRMRNPSVSEKQLESLGRGSRRYARHVKGAAAAIEERELARSAYYGLRSLLEWDKTAVAHQNVLARLGEP